MQLHRAYLSAVYPTTVVVTIASVAGVNVWANVTLATKKPLESFLFEGY